MTGRPRLMPGDGDDGPRDIRIPGGVITVAGPDRRIVVNGKTYRFERDYCGCPWLLNRQSDPTDTPGERHPFWLGFNRWLAQGCRVDGDLCVWAPGPPRKVRRISRRHTVLVDEPAGWCEADGTVEVDNSAPILTEGRDPPSRRGDRGEGGP